MQPYNRHLITHARHPIAAPLHPHSVLDLIERAVGDDDAARPRILDLGCGEGAWLLEVLAHFPGARAVGVDIDGGGLARAAEQAEALGVADRLELHEMPAADYRAAERFDVVLNVGATHAFGGLLPTLEAARAHLAPGGRALIGDGFWEREPTPAVLEILGESPDAYADLAGTVDRITGAGWTPVYGHTSTLDEWDDYEWSWTGSLAEWALDHPDHPRAGEAAETAAAHRTAWLHGYRGTLGFVTLVLRRTA
ncbi:class I SAM-dependent methyltransferase [Streptomyces sp. XM4011]|uniref:SAM-dependent methyltransferase n=1 Tax=Streptomyces sp. XM4011 TaxID=2929780 RepID=UPI001FF9273F|nr:class I SAM-dependent methyltransferase [Streptomyces sp. XM4011]MCK1814769.1 class I SAM-dependent methyltransferase [Streptomyces sp. XM4011]